MTGATAQKFSARGHRISNAELQGLRKCLKTPKDTDLKPGKDAGKKVMKSTLIKFP